MVRKMEGEGSDGTRSIGFRLRDKPVDRGVVGESTASRMDSSVRLGIQVEAVVVRGRFLFGGVIVGVIHVLFLRGHNL